MHLNSIEFETIISHTNEPIDNSYWKSAQINSQMSPNSLIINNFFKKWVHPNRHFFSRLTCEFNFLSELQNSDVVLETDGIEILVRRFSGNENLLRLGAIQF